MYPLDFETHKNFPKIDNDVFLEIKSEIHKINKCAYDYRRLDSVKILFETKRGEFFVQAVAKINNKRYYMVYIDNKERNSRDSQKYSRESQRWFYKNFDSIFGSELKYDFVAET